MKGISSDNTSIFLETEKSNIHKLKKLYSIKNET